MAMKQMRAQVADDLIEISRVLHDSWIRLPPDLHANSQKLELSGVWRFGSDVPVRTLGPLVLVDEFREGFALLVGHVTRVEVIDSAEVGWLDVDRLTYDNESRRLEVVGNIPAAIRLQVQALDVQLAVRGAESDVRRRWRVAWHRPRKAL